MEPLRRDALKPCAEMVLVEDVDKERDHVAFVDRDEIRQLVSDDEERAILDNLPGVVAKLAEFVFPCVHALGSAHLLCDVLAALYRVREEVGREVVNHYLLDL